MEINQVITNDVIDQFANGHDPMERIVNLDYKSNEKEITVYFRDDNDNKCERKEAFYPFLWSTRSACLKMCGGNREKLKELMRKYGMAVKKLRTTDKNGNEVESLSNGYIFQWYATSPLSYQSFLKFFKECDNPIYSDRQDKLGSKEVNRTEAEKQFLCVTPQEQFLIRTGKRFFKGYNDYNDLLRMTFDLETTGLDPRHNHIEQLGVRFNRPFPGHPDGFEKIFNVSGNTQEELNKSEMSVIITIVQIIYTFRPDVVTAHNGENFDWDFIITRSNILGYPIEEFSKQFFNGAFIHKNQKESTLKLGGEVETYYQTIVPGTIITDSLHAVRRAQAIDSNMLRADLKYATKYAKMAKPNRVYVPGDQISVIYNDLEEHYAFNNINGDWYKISDSMPLKENYVLKTGKYIVERYLLDDIWECDKVEHKFNTTNFLICKLLPIPYQKCTTMGTAGQWKAWMMAWSYENGLAVPQFGDGGSFTGGLSRLLKTGYVENVIKLDYNSLYPSIILTWGIDNDKDISEVTLKLLEFVLTEREKYKGLKKKAGKIVDKLESKVMDKTATEDEIKEYNQAAADYAFNDKKQAQMKVFGNSFFGSYGAPNLYPWGSKVCAERTTCTGRMALRLMISHFSKLGYSPIVGDTDGFNFKLPDASTYRYTKENPYVGKGSNREVKLGVEYSGFEADVAEFNDLYMKDVHGPKGVQKMGLGIDEVVSSTINFSRKNYADYFPEKPFPEDVKMVGNTIKSKKMPEYISKFLSKAIRLLLQNKGHEFLEEYYNYIEKIYNYRIPLRDIASKGKVKKSINEYIEDCSTLTKAGRPKSRQCWMELAIKEGLDVHMGDTLYYINTGKSKSQSDVKKVTRYFQIINGEKTDVTKKFEKEYKQWSKTQEYINLSNDGKFPKVEYIKKYYPGMKTEEEIILNAELLPNDIIDSDEETYCEEGMEYNSSKYIDQFNKRITPLLVCFSSEIRNKILITNPSDRQYFTDEESVLVSGQPNKEGDQDTYEQLMTMEDKEIKFWMAHPEFEIPFADECDMNIKEIFEDYNKRQKEELDSGISIEKEYYQNIIQSLSEEDINAFFDGKLPDKLNKIIVLDPTTNNFISKKYEGHIIGSIYDIIDRAS